MTVFVAPEHVSTVIRRYRQNTSGSRHGRLSRRYEPVTGRRYFPDGYRALRMSPGADPLHDHRARRTFARTDSTPTTSAVHCCPDFGRWRHAMRRAAPLRPGANSTCPTDPTAADESVAHARRRRRCQLLFSGLNNPPAPSESDAGVVQVHAAGGLSSSRS